MNKNLHQKFYIAILQWFHKNKRNFPWRHQNTKFYDILIAEILLRKTSAQMVSNFFPKFIEKYPNFKAINKNSKKILEQDLKPLGLFKTRADILKKIAREIEDNRMGKIPSSYEELISLYGIGKYLANAILCFGLNKKRILVDTNINRIYSRVLNKKFPKRINKNHPLWLELGKLIDSLDTKNLFMALIDFGAIICKERGYNCNICPVLEICQFKGKQFKF